MDTVVEDVDSLWTSLDNDISKLAGEGWRKQDRSLIQHVPPVSHLTVSTHSLITLSTHSLISMYHLSAL